MSVLFRVVSQLLDLGFCWTAMSVARDAERGHCRAVIYSLGAEYDGGMEKLGVKSLHRTFCREATLGESEAELERVVG